MEKTWKKNLVSGNYPFCQTCVKHQKFIFIFCKWNFLLKNTGLVANISRRLSSLSEGFKWRRIIVIGDVIGVALPETLAITLCSHSFDQDTVHPVPEKKCYPTRKPEYEKNLGTRDLG